MFFSFFFFFLKKKKMCDSYVVLNNINSIFHYHILNDFEIVNYHYPIVKAPNPSVIASSNFCSIISNEVYEGKSIQLILII